MHFHIDWSNMEARDDQLVSIAQECQANGWPSKVTRIVRARPGSHIHHPEFQDVYATHTPDLLSSGNSFNTYLTALLADEAKTSDDIARHCDGVRRFFEKRRVGFGQTVIEIERVIAKLDGSTIHVAEPAECKSTAGLFEIHHFANLPVGANISFDDWESLSNNAGICVGGWFQFERDGETAFRSVRFARSLDVVELVNEARSAQRLASHVYGPGTTAETIVEQVLDIWRI